MTAESLALTGDAAITGDLLVPGTPVVREEGRTSFGGIVAGTGDALPGGFDIRLSGNARLGSLRTRTNPTPFSVLASVAKPAGSRNVTIVASGESVGDWAAVRDLTLGGNVGQYSVPPGAYGHFTANGGSGFTLGLAGATQPAVYHFQRLELNGQSRLLVAGPVIIHLASSLVTNGLSGTSVHPQWLELRLPSGGLTLNGGSLFHGYVVAPNGSIIVHGHAELAGGVECDSLAVNSGGMLRLWSRKGGGNQSPVTHDQEVALDEDSPAEITLTAADPDSVTLTFAVVTQPAHGRLEGVVPNLTYIPAPDYHGTDSFTYAASDGEHTSPPAAVTLAIRRVTGTSRLLHRSQLCGM